MTARLAIDWTRCDGHGLCRALLPDRIGVDEWGFPALDQQPIAEERLGDAKRAVAACPALALYLEQTVPSRS